MENFTKIVMPGKTLCGKYNRKVFVEIRWTDGNLTMHGVVGPLKSGNCYGSCGQIQDTVLSSYAKGWSKDVWRRFQSVWNEYHLNNMQPGSPRQREYLAEEFPNEWLQYEDACRVLKEAGLYEDTEYLFEGKPYKYGSSWLMKEVPEEVVEFLHDLPNAEEKPAWI